MKTIKLSKIKISKAFERSIPNEDKMRECRHNWETYQKQDRYIVVNNKGYLIDGYVMYLILKENEVECAEVKNSNYRKKRWYRKKDISNCDIPKYKNNNTTYVFGVHPNCSCQQEFVWRIPESYVCLAKNIQVGDIVFCSTKFGCSPVVVTKIESLDKPPINIPIKKVCKKKILRGEMVVEY